MHSSCSDQLFVIDWTQLNNPNHNLAAGSPSTLVAPKKALIKQEKVLHQRSWMTRLLTFNQG